MSYETRLDKLERAMAPRRECTFLIARNGEDGDECIRSAGYDPNDPTREFIVFCIRVAEESPGMTEDDSRVLEAERVAMREARLAEQSQRAGLH